MNTVTEKKIEDNPHRWFIVAAVMLATIMEILDTTIVNVSLPHMMGSLSADRDEISWVLTSYIVAAGVLMPLTGFLVKRFGCKQLLLMNVIGFMFASALCGISDNLLQIVIFRLLQGTFGASLVPLSQFILRDSFPLKEQPKLMAVWGIGVMAAPIMGPTLGGYITETLNWRWVFYINVPVCLIDFFLILRFIKESPVSKGAIDWLGMILMIVSVGALQLFLDRGESDNWFSSPLIRWLFIIFLLSLLAFFIHSLKSKNSIINLRLFADRNFASGTLIMGFFAASVLGSLALLPQMLESLYGYTSNLTGLVMAPRGIASGIGMVICVRLLSKGVDARWPIAFGLGAGAYTTLILSQINLETSMNYIIALGFIQGLAIGCFFMPLSTVVYATLPPTAMAEAAGLFAFGRNIGNAIGISLLVTYLDRSTQANWHQLANHVQPTNPNLIHWAAAQQLSLTDTHTISRLARLVSQQANFLAFMQTFKLCAMILLIAMLMVFLIKPNKRQPIAVEAH